MNISKRLIFNRRSAGGSGATFYAQQTSQGTGDGLSEANASDVSSIPWGSMVANDTIYLMDTVTDPIVVGASGITVRGDLAGRELLHDTTIANPTSGFVWNNGGNCKMYGGHYTSGNNDCILIKGAYDIELFNVQASNCRNNQNISFDGTGTAICNDIISTGAADDGVTGHDSANVTIQGASTSITGNSEGVAVAGTGSTTIIGVTIEGNTLWDVVFEVDIQDSTIGKIHGTRDVTLSNVNVTTLLECNPATTATVTANDCVIEGYRNRCRHHRNLYKLFSYRF